MQTIVLWRDNPLRDLCQGTYVLNVAKKVNNSKFGKQYILSLGEEDNPSIVWSNKTISGKLQEAEDFKTYRCGWHLSKSKRQETWIFKNYRQKE
jgi:hypothetical protein